MPQVGIVINGRSYRIACDDGQEEHLKELAQLVDKRVAELVATMGQVGDTRLLVMASLLVADELAEAYAEVDRVRANDGDVARSAEGADALVHSIERLALRVEHVAAQLERD